MTAPSASESARVGEKVAVCDACIGNDHEHCTDAKSGVFPAPGGGFAIHCCCVEVLRRARPSGRSPE